MHKVTAKPRFLIVAVTINTLVFLFLSFLHFYWALGGKLWFTDVLPTNSTGTIRLNPGSFATIVVAFALLIFAFINMGSLGLFDKFLPRKYFHLGTLLIAIIFFIRAIGDFRFVGFFKVVTKTKFAHNDTYLYSPLCLVVALLSFIIFLMSRNKG